MKHVVCGTTINYPLISCKIGWGNKIGREDRMLMEEVRHKCVGESILAVLGKLDE